MHKKRYITAEPTRTQIYRLTQNFTSKSLHKKNVHLQQIVVQYKCHVQHHSFHINTSFTHSGKCESHETSVIINAVLSALWLTHSGLRENCAHTHRTFHRTVFHGCSPNLGKFGRFFNCFLFFRSVKFVSVHFR